MTTQDEQDGTETRFILNRTEQEQRTQPTPGPWYAVHAEVRKDYNDVAYVVAKVTPTDEAEANARLIAAAPDLRAACKLAHLQIGKLAQHYMSSEVMKWLRDNEAYQATFAAIAKAEGRAA